MCERDLQNAGVRLHEPRPHMISDPAEAAMPGKGFMTMPLLISGKSGIPEFRKSGFPEIRDSGIPEIRKSGFPEFRKLLTVVKCA